MALKTVPSLFYQVLESRPTQALLNTGLYPPILRDKTMEDKLICTPRKNKITPSMN